MVTQDEFEAVSYVADLFGFCIMKAAKQWEFMTFFWDSGWCKKDNFASHGGMSFEDSFLCVGERDGGLGAV